MNNYCKRCRLRDGCLQKCKEAEVYEQGYNDAVEEFKKLKKITMEKHLIEVACEAYCKCCDTKECEDLGEYNDFNCDWVCKFRKEFTKKLNKDFKTKQQWKKN